MTRASRQHFAWSTPALRRARTVVADSRCAPIRADAGRSNQASRPAFRVACKIRKSCGLYWLRRPSRRGRRPSFDRGVFGGGIECPHSDSTDRPMKAAGLWATAGGFQQRRKSSNVGVSVTSCRQALLLSEPRPRRQICRSTIFSLSSAIALAGSRLFGQALAQFMMVWQR